MKLSRDEMDRYDRQILIGSLGLEGQLKLKGAKVVIAGAGGLGCSATIYLAAAGIGYMRIIDEEDVELSNLNRQIGHWNRDIGTAKANSLGKKIRELNPEVELEPVTQRITSGTVRDLISGFTVVLDCMDNWETRFTLNKACVAARVPLVHAGVHSLYGQITSVLPGKGPCLRCILPETPQSEDKIPILGVTAGTLGLLEALEAIKIITGMGQPLAGRMLYFDGESTSFYEINVSKREDCPVCGSIT